jgi:internalin A
MSKLAQGLIAENMSSKATFLDLGNCGLHELPAKVSDLLWLEHLLLASEWFEWDGENWQTKKSRNAEQQNHLADLAPLAHLTSLQGLHFSDTQVTDLAPLARLIGLQTLDLSHTQVSDLAPLADLTNLQTLNLSVTQVSDLAPLARLTALQTLYLSNTQVSDLAPLAHLTSLQMLHFSDTDVSDLAPLADLTSLQTLYLSDTQVTDLAPLKHLTSLHTLHFSDTQVTDLAPLKHLISLQRLHLSDTQVSDLAPLMDVIRRGNPVKWSSKSREGNGIYIENCPLTNPPPEIAARGNDAILNYFTERARGDVDHLYEAKMLILGEGGAGKTSLLRRLYKPGEVLPTEKETTRGIAIHKHEFKMKNGRAFRLNVWDFGGQQIYHATHQFFLTHRSLYVLVDDTRKDNTSVSDGGFKYWLELIDVFGGHSPTLIFQNEKDDRSKPIDFRGIKQRYDNVKELYVGNLDRRNAADRVRDAIEFHAANLSHVGEELPSRWIKVREEIEALAASKPYIPVEKYFEVYSEQIENDETKALLLSRYLHDLGVFLHFQDDPLLRRTVILQNEWATDAAFRIIDDEAIKEKLGRFTGEDCARLWKGSDYAHMHPELLALMQNFELCYELRDSSPPTWLAPQLLPPAKPEELGAWAKPDDLVLRYKYEFLPKGIIGRLTVRLHRFVRDPEKAWTTGVLFEHDGTAALVEILPEGSEIETRARGPEHKALLSVIAADLDALNDSFKGLRDKVGKRIPCNCNKCRISADPQFFEQKALLRRKEHGALKVECEKNWVYVDVMQLLDGIKMEKPPDWAKDDSAGGADGAPGVTPRVIRIFLASSFELREDRDQFDLYFRTQNDRLMKQGIYLEIVRWEHFLDAMSETRLQDEYNEAVRNCDIFVCLFFTKAGKFTQEEFDVAFRSSKEKGTPLIFTFCKKASVDIDSLSKEDFDSLMAFKNKLKSLGHFYTKYASIEDLKLQFRDQLDMVIGRTHEAKADRSHSA